MNLVSPKKAVSLKEASRFWLQLGLVSFGGAYAVLPYVAHGAVEQFGWLTASQMLDGLGPRGNHTWALDHGGGLHGLLEPWPR